MPSTHDGDSHDEHGYLTEERYDELYALVVEAAPQTWEARAEWFDAMMERYPDITENDLWYVWRDYYDSL